MSKQPDNLDNSLSEAPQNARKLVKTARPLGDADSSTAVEIAKQHSAKDILLWLLALSALVGATLVNYKLQGIWQPANDMWVRTGIIAALVIFAIVCLALTHQGKSFKVLLKDAGIELRRVAWPSKNETVQYTWQTLVVIAIVAFLVWLLDNFFNWWVGLFLS